MSGVLSSPPPTKIEEVTDVLHGVSVSDPYRWLEDQKSEQTRAWLDAQSGYVRSYLDAVAGRDRIKSRVRELLAVETMDSLLCSDDRCVFRKRAPEQEQAGIYLRSGSGGPDELLLDPAEIDQDRFTSIKPVRLSRDGRLLLFEIKHGGERMGRFGILDIQSRRQLSDELPHGYLRGFAFAPDARSFYYVHEAEGVARAGRHSVNHHVLGTALKQDQEIFAIDGDKNTRLHIAPGEVALGFLVHRLCEKTYTDFYFWRFQGVAVPLIKGAEYRIGPHLHSSGRIFAMTDRNARNFRIVELCLKRDQEPEFVEIVPESSVPIADWTTTERWICISYVHSRGSSIHIFNLQGKKLRELIVNAADNVRMTSTASERDEIFLERESFTSPVETYRYSIRQGRPQLWNRRKLAVTGDRYSHVHVRFTSKDDVEISMFLVGRRDVLASGLRPTVMTSYGGFGVSVKPQFSALVMYLMERGCLFALPRIRGGSDFGRAWHDAARRRKRQVAIDDFLTAAEWLISTGRTDSRRLAIFGGSNSGLLVLAAMTQRPDLFRAVLAIAPLSDMVRYHMFDRAYQWREELGTSEDPDDLAALTSYSPYHRVRDGGEYPATMIVSGDRDQNCNSLHARKMTARLQAANRSVRPIVLDYSPLRGHSPVLPLSERIRALTDRLAFLTDQLELEN